MLFSLFPANIVFAETVASGSCGDNATWTLDSEGTLTISGSGTMQDYGSQTPPWTLYNYRNQVKKIIISDKITELCSWCFSYLLNVKEITIPDSVIKIGEYAFANCENLETVHLSENITKIPNRAFYKCKSLLNISIPDNVEKIGQDAFIQCESIKSIDIPENTVVGAGVFINCYSLESINVNENNSRQRDIDGVLIDCWNNELECYPNKKGEIYVIPNSISRIGYAAFWGCNGLKKLYIPKTVKYFSDSYIFVGCDNLTIYYEGSESEWNTLSKKLELIDNISIVTDCENSVIESISLSENEIVIESGYTYTLYTNIKPQSAEFKKVIWSSSDDDVATVNSNGVIKGISEGTAVIIAEDETGNCMDACVVEVKNPTLVNKIELDKSQISIVEGESETITAAISPSNATNSNIVWSSSDESVATVSNGVVTAVSAGSAEIKVSSEDGNAIATCNVNVEKKYALEKISFESSKLMIDAGSTANIKVLYTPENATYKNVTWKSSKPAVATVENGTVKGISAGTSVITATSEDGGFKATCIVTVVQPVKVTGITLDKSTADIILNNTETLVATISPTDATNKNVIWKSDNANIASVENGMVSAKSVGTTKVYAISEDGEYKAECIIKVLPIPVTGITLDKTELSLNIGSTSKVNATVLPENAENKNVSWTSSNTDVADVDSNGNITAKSIGNTEIKAETEIGGYTAICKVSVLPINVSGIALSSSEVSLAEKATTTISATITPENATDKTVIWSSNNEKVATVTNGVITGISEGTAVIIAKTNDGNYTAYCAVTVTAAKVSVKSISLNQSSLTIVEGYTDTISASIKPENATNQNVLWSSNNKNVATVENGMITAVTPGTAVIIATAEDGGQIATCIVNVVSAMQDQVSKPIASVLSGAVQTGENILLLTATRGAEIHYTTDGSAPTKESKLYTEPIQITEALKLKAVAVKSGMIDSDVASFSYTIADPNVPYVSVQTNLTGNKGETTTVSVNISENSGSAGGSFNLVYDTDSVELVSVENGTYISKANPIVNDSYANNKIRTVWAGSKALSGGGEILSATFRILDSTQNDTAYFNLEKLKIADDNATKLTCLQSNGVLALMSVDTAVQDKEFLTQSVLAEDNKTLSVTVSANTEDTAKLYAAVYDDKQLIQIKSIDVMKNSEPYNIVFDTAVKDTQIIKVFVWDENMMPLSTGETVEK